MTMTVDSFKDCDKASQEAAKWMAAQLEENSNKRCLLLVSGGSSIAVASWLANNLDINTTNSVTLALIDERFGEEDKLASNWEQLKANGVDPTIFFANNPVLGLGTTLQDTAQSYEQQLRSLVADNDYTIGLLGIGADSHIAGMLPMDDDEFDRFLDDRLVVGYQGPDFQRITTTKKLLSELDDIVVYACGPAKVRAILKLQSEAIASEQPAQMLKEFKNVKIFVGEQEV